MSNQVDCDGPECSMCAAGISRTEVVTIFDKGTGKTTEIKLTPQLRRELKERGVKFLD